MYAMRRALGDRLLGSTYRRLAALGLTLLVIVEVAMHLVRTYVSVAGLMMLLQVAAIVRLWNGGVHRNPRRNY
jgi:hypothetical protein